MPFSVNSRMGIRKRIFLLLVVVFVPLLVFEVHIFYRWYLDRKEAEMQANLELAKAVSNNFATFLQGLLGSELSAGLALSASRPMADSDRAYLLDTFQADNPAVTNVSWINTDGVSVAASGGAPVGISAADREYFQRIKAGHDWAVSELLVSRISGKLSFTVSQGIRNPKGVLLGVVTAEVDPTRLDSALAVIRKNDAGVSLIDNKGIHVYRYPTLSRLTLEQRDWLKLYPALERALKGEDVVASQVARVGRDMRLVAFTPVPSIGWVAACSRPEGEVVADIMETLFPQAFLMFLATIVAFGSALLLSRPIIASIRELRSHAEALGRGEEEWVEAKSAPEELRALAKSFSEMAGKVRQREEALRQGEKKYRQIFDNTNDIMAINELVCDERGRPIDWRVLDVNPAHLRSSGRAREDVVGRTFSEIYGRNASESFLNLAAQLVKTGEPAQYEKYFESDGMYALISAFHLGDSRFASITVDITEQKRAEGALRRANDELEQRVEERTEELRKAYEQLKEETREREKLEKQLRQAQKMEALGTMAGGIAHDFNNLLAAMIGFSELTIDDLPEGSVDRHNLEQVLKAGLRGRDLVKQMLIFSRKTEQERKPLLLAHVIKETENLLRASIPSTIGMRVEMSSVSPVLADSVGVQQIVMNLCSNASDAMRDSGGVLCIEVADVEDGDRVPGLGRGDYVRLTVSDTGVGIPQHIIDRIFDPFFTTKEVGRGTGLGLSVVHGIVESLGGTIIVESEPGKGSAFRVYLPKASSQLEEEPGVEVPMQGGEERVLFVDDEEMLVDMATRMMGELGYTVTGCATSAGAFRLFQEKANEFDLVITDQTMPEMTGLQLAKELKKVRQDIPIVLATGFSHLVDAQSTEAAGITACVMKPLTKKELARTIREVLDKAS